MEQTRKYHVVAWWTSGQTGITKSDSAPSAVHFTAPPEFGGVEGRWTPEDLLLSAIAGCYTTTFQAIAGHSKFGYTDLEVETEATACKVGTGYTFTEIVVRPKLTIACESERSRGVDLLKKAQTLCLVSRALSTPARFEPAVVVRAEQSVSVE
jgi:organic hydroperoxide reductase OsmC/OhrA